MLQKTLFKSFSNNNTKKKKETKKKYKRQKRNGNNISDTCIVSYNKMDNYKEQYKKKGDKELKSNGYVLPYRVVKPDTAHFEISLLNADA